MDVCNKGDIYRFLYLPYCLCSLHIRDSRTHELASCLFQSLNLLDCCLYISSISICHGLDRDRGIASNLYFTYGNLCCFSAGHTFGKCNLWPNTVSKLSVQILTYLNKVCSVLSSHPFLVFGSNLAICTECS